MLVDEVCDLIARTENRESAYSRRERLAVAEQIESFADGKIAAARGDDAEARAGRYSMTGRGTNLRCRLVLQQKAIDDFLILVRNFGVAAELVMARTTSEICAFRMHARAECGPRRQFRSQACTAGTVVIVSVPRRQDSPAVRPIGFVPPEPRHYPVVHADVEIGQHDHRRLETLRQDRRHWTRIRNIRPDSPGKRRMCLVSPCDA